MPRRRFVSTATVTAGYLLFVANVARRARVVSQDEALRLPLITAAEYGHAVTRSEQADEVFYERRLACSTRRQIAHTDDGHGVSLGRK